MELINELKNESINTVLRLFISDMSSQTILSGGFVYFPIYPTFLTIHG